MSTFVSHVPFQLTGRYADRNRWESLAGPGDSRVTAEQVIQDEGLVGTAWGNDKVALVTGVSSGIGPETVRVLAQTGATVFGTARNLDKAREALGAPLLATGRVHLLFVDQTDLASVRACADEFRKQSKGRLNIMINNAGVMKTPKSQTKDGFELQFGTNHLSHFLLFHLLQDLLIASATPEFHSRVVNVSSSGHRYAPLRPADPHFAARPEEYGDGWPAYGASKTANILMASGVERRLGARRVHGLALNPGTFESPNLQRHCVDEMAAGLRDPRLRAYLCSVPQGAATSVYGAVSAELEGRGGLYLEGAAVAGPCPPDADVLEFGYGSWAFDQEMEEQLWEMSAKMVGVE